MTLLHKAVFCDCRSANAKVVLIACLAKCNVVWTRSFPHAELGYFVRVNQTHLAKALHMKRESVNKYVKYLKDKGYLTDFEPYKNNAGHKGKLYRINLGD